MSGDRESVTIVGAGIVGIACAHYLEQAGLEVTLLDQGSIAGECSLANCGYICPSHALPLTEPGAFGIAFRSMFNPNSPFRVKPQWNPSLWKWMFQFAKRCTHQQMLAAGKPLQAILESSMAEYHRLIDQFQLECEWKEDGLLYVLQTQRGMDHFAATDEIVSKHFGIAATRMNGDEVPEFEPGLKSGLAGAFLYPGDTSVRPDKLNQAWASSLQLRGGAFSSSIVSSDRFARNQDVSSLWILRRARSQAIILCLLSAHGPHVGNRNCNARSPYNPARGTL